MHPLKSQPMFLKLPKQNGANHLTFQAEFSVFPMSVVNLSTPETIKIEGQHFRRHFNLNTVKRLSVSFTSSFFSYLFIGQGLFTFSSFKHGLIKHVIFHNKPIIDKASKNWLLLEK